MMFTLVVESSHPLRYTLPMRQQIPLHAGASGLAILAFLPTQSKTGLRTGRSPLTPTLIDPEGLYERLDQERRDGTQLPTASVSMVRSRSPRQSSASAGTVVGSAGISMPEARFNARTLLVTCVAWSSSPREITDYLTARPGATHGHAQ